jgi:hypothetical protein
MLIFVIFLLVAELKRVPRLAFWDDACIQLILSDETGDWDFLVELNVEVALPVVKVAQSAGWEDDRTRLMSFKFLESNWWTETFEPECKMFIVLIWSDFNNKIFLKALTFVELAHFLNWS